tara:strand:+ start:1536 stop:1850 length:315 start_codon:yes stop_codon:yes gene_type:complete
MAKLKKKKKTNKIIQKLKGIKPEKVTEQQLQKIQNLVNGINRWQLEIGSIETQKHELMHRVGGLKEALSTMQKELEKDYGTFDVNIQDGTINYTKENGEVNKED